MQRYQCNTCSHVFYAKRKKKKSSTYLVAQDYIFHKQTYGELKSIHGMDRRKMQDILEDLAVQEKVHTPRPIHLLVDATYFGERKQGRSWCVLVARDPERKENLTWRFADTETTYGYVLLKEELESLGYTILSVTGDGFSGIRSAFYRIPFQMCHVHMERLVVQGTTRNPLTEAGQVLLALTKTLHHTNSHLFMQRLKKFADAYQEFLVEKTFHPVTGGWSYTHDGVRMAYMSLMRFRKYLFTYEHTKDIPKTTNSLEGHFKHLKKYLGIHSGLTRAHQQKILAVILQASSVSPGKKTLETIWK